MTAYKFESNVNGLGIVDLKATNLHMSARPDTTLNVAGASAFGTLPYTSIPAGAIVTSGSDAGSVDVSVGTAPVLGVAIDSRASGDVRPITYTWQGYVRLVAGTGNVAAGDLLCADTQAAYYGCAVTYTPDIDGTNADALTSMKLVFGKALTAADAGKTFEAYIDCSGV